MNWSSYAGPWTAGARRRHPQLVIAAAHVGATPAWAALRMREDGSAQVWLHGSACVDPRDPNDGTWLADPTGCDVEAVVAADGAVRLVTP